MSLNPEDFNLVHLEIARQDPAPASTGGPSQIGHQLESLAVAGRNLEVALQREREYSKQLRDYITQLISRFNSLQKVEKEQARELQELRTAVKESSRRVSELTTDLAKVRSELERYRSAWSDVLTREQKAQAILARSETSERRLSELEAELKALEQKYLAEKAHRERAESHVNVHRAELQNSLVRLHSSEGRFNDMTKELESLHSIRKNHALELAKAVETARQQAEGELVRQYDQLSRELHAERVRAEKLAGELGERQERNRKESEEAVLRERDRVKTELEARFAADRARLEGQAREALVQANEREARDRAQIVRTLTESLECTRDELKRNQSELLTIEEHARATELELLRLKTELAQADRNQNMEHSRSLQSERDRAAHLQREHELSSRKLFALEAEAELSQECLIADKRTLSLAVSRFLASWDLEDSTSLAGGAGDFVRAVAELCGILLELGKLDGVELPARSGPPPGPPGRNNTGPKKPAPSVAVPAAPLDC